MSDNDRQKIIEEKLGKKEAALMKDLALIRQTVNDFLIDEKGYSRADMEFDKEFEVLLDGRKFLTSVDYIIKLNGRRFMVIKCSPGSLESRERHLIAFARVVDAHQIPFAVLTEGSYARVLDAVSGRLVSEGLDSIPDRAQAVKIMGSMEFKPYPPERMEREKRILLAFDVIKCTEELCE